VSINIDILVAKHAMGHTAENPPPPYSTDRGLALEALEAIGCAFAIEDDEVIVWDEHGNGIEVPYNPERGQIRTATMALCIALLRERGVRV
jgi:hypothetical protein